MSKRPHVSPAGSTQRSGARIPRIVCTADFTLENHGSIFLMRPRTKRAAAWLDDTAPEDAQFFANALAIEPRYVPNVAAAARGEGFTIQGGLIL